MSKVIISATIDSDTKKEVKKLARKEKRSFSSMVDFLLSESIKRANT